MPFLIHPQSASPVSACHSHLFSVSIELRCLHFPNYLCSSSLFLAPPLQFVFGLQATRSRLFLCPLCLLCTPLRPNASESHASTSALRVVHLEKYFSYSWGLLMSICNLCPKSPTDHNNQNIYSHWIMQNKVTTVTYKMFTFLLRSAGCREKGSILEVIGCKLVVSRIIIELF